MNKKQRQEIWKTNHLKALVSLGFIGSFRTLRTLENRVNYQATRYANGEITQDEYFLTCDRVELSLKKQFKDSKLPDGFFFNGDCRGYSLKIESDSAPIGIHKDWGGYLIIAPNFAEMS